jgi:hypothetical protein
LAKRFIFTLWAIPLLVFAAIAYGFDDTSSGPLVPEGLVIEDAFKPGIGSPVGKVGAVRGEALIVHEDALSGYRAQKDLPLSKGDTIIALEKGRIKLELNDGSTLTLIPETRLTLSESTYDPEKKERSSYIDVTMGKVRFAVTKLSDYRRSVFEVDTPTSATGLRGSDFVTLAMADVSEITAFEDTTLEVRSKDFPEEPPLLIQDFERAVVERGKRPVKVKVPRDEAEQLKEEFQLPDEETPKLAGVSRSDIEGIWLLKNKGREWVDVAFGREGSDLVGEVVKKYRRPGSSRSWMGFTIDGIECDGNKITVSCGFEYSKGKLPPRNMILHLANDASRLEGFFEDDPDTRITGERKHER